MGENGPLPRYLTASVAGEGVGIVHGDPEPLAGWRLALEAMEPGDPAVRRQVGWRGRPTTPADLLDWFGRADVKVFAGTHTGLPYAQVIPTAHAAGWWSTMAPPACPTSPASATG